jgi:hypothetical protein
MPRARLWDFLGGRERPGSEGLRVRTLFDPFVSVAKIAFPRTWIDRASFRNKWGKKSPA